MLLDGVGRRRIRIGLVGLCGLVLLVGCGGTVVYQPPPVGDGGQGGQGGQGMRASKVDLLLVVDNSRSMADKQQALALTVPDLVRWLVNPPCAQADGKLASEQPADPQSSCPVAGTERLFAPLTDLHVGVVSSSLGGHGADACAGENAASENDAAHLIARSGVEQGDPAVPTWSDKGFLVWDPDPVSPTHNPPGESDSAAVTEALGKIVTGAGQVGCGYEAPLEAWYRFLIDPDPHEHIEIVKGTADLKGTDGVLLQQRADFLRADSLLVVLVLSDENDCSIRDGGQFYFAAQIYAPGTNNPYHLPKPRAACATDPLSPCCRSCGQSPGVGCDPDADNCGGSLDQIDDSINLRCFDQKRRFGIDFLWPLDRYASGLTDATVADRDGNAMPNPVFSPSSTYPSEVVRDSSLVLFGAIVGVPWQDVARRDGAGKPSLVLGLMSADELTKNGVWPIILGDPDEYVPPTDPLMIESIAPRSGANPITGDPIMPPGSAEGANPINGHEYAIPDKNDLQYACIFPITPRDCNDPDVTACDCNDPSNEDHNPLCDPAEPTTQKYAKAYPGLRELAVARSVGPRGLVGSICPGQLGNAAAADFGYRAMMLGLVRAASSRLE